MFRVVIGHSEDVLAAAAAGEVLGQVRKELAGGLPQAGILLCSVDFEHALILAAIREAFPGIQLAGCTTDGELSSTLGFREDSLVLILFVTDSVEIVAGAGREAARRGREAGREAAAAASSGLRLRNGQERFAVILADPLNAGISDVDQGIQDVLGRTFPVIGGSAAAHSKQKKTFQFCNDEILSDGLVLLLFAGPVTFSCGIKGGHSPLGMREQVTRAEKNVLYEIGGRPAIEYFRKYTGHYDLFMNYCLAVYEQDRDSFYVRIAPSSDPATGSVTLNGRVPEGAFVQIGTANKDNIVRSCDESLSRALADYPGSCPAAGLIFSCAGRKMIMGTQITQELRTVQNRLPGIPFAGFYCFGEFGPLRRDHPYMFHGTTFVTLLLGPIDEG